MMRKQANSGAVVADVGGTNTRFARVSLAGVQSDLAIYSNAEHASFAELLARYFAETQVECTTLAVAVAGPVKAGAVQMTNLPWCLSAADLSAEFAIEHVYLVNDFEAQAWATLRLAENELRYIGAAKLDPKSARAVLGPGTGLGISGLLPVGEDWVVIAGEGGHLSMPALNESEALLVDTVISQFGHCSAERLLSGPGLLYMQNFFGGTAKLPEQVTELARQGDAAALKATVTFSEMLGTVAADLALAFGARGGVYLTGGVIPRIGELFRADLFRQRFIQKGRFSDYLDTIATVIVNAQFPALRGLALYLEKQTARKAQAEFGQQQGAA